MVVEVSPELSTTGRPDYDAETRLVALYEPTGNDWFVHTDHVEKALDIMTELWRMSRTVAARNFSEGDPRWDQLAEAKAFLRAMGRNPTVR